MTPPRLAFRAVLALALAALVAPAALAQTSFLAVSEVTGGANGRGEVLIYQQDNGTGALMNGGNPVATITSQSQLANPMGLAFATDASGDGHLYIAGLGSDSIINFDVTKNQISSVTPVSGGFSYLNGMAIAGNQLYVSAFNGGSGGNGGVLEYTIGSNGSISGSPVIAQGQGLVNPTGIALGPDGFTVNSSANNQIFLVNGTNLTATTFAASPTPQLPSAPAGLAFFGSELFEANFFNDFHNTTPVGVGYFSQNNTTFTYQTSSPSISYHNPTLGGPAGIVVAPVAWNEIFVSDYGDGRIYTYGLNTPGANPTTYLSGLTTPSYMVEFTSSLNSQGMPTFSSQSVPEPSSVALLALGGAAGLVVRRRLRRATSVG